MDINVLLHFIFLHLYTFTLGNSFQKFSNDFYDEISKFLQFKSKTFSMKHIIPKSSSNNSQTVVVPLVQCGGYGVRIEEKFTEQAFNYLSKHKDVVSVEKLYLASGYLNLPSNYEQLLLDLIDNHHDLVLELLCASPEVGFMFELILKIDWRLYNVIFESFVLIKFEQIDYI